MANTAIGFEYGVTGEDFNPEVGFLENEDGYRRFLFRFEETLRQEKVRRWGFREFLPHMHLHAVQLPRRRPAECRAARRQPLGLGERQFHQRRAQRHVGRTARAVRGLSGHHRSAGRAWWLCSVHLRANTDRRKAMFCERLRGTWAGSSPAIRAARQPR